MKNNDQFSSNLHVQNRFKNKGIRCQPPRPALTSQRGKRTRCYYTGDVNGDRKIIAGEAKLRIL